MADGAGEILRQLGLNWLECQDEQGIFYFNQATQQSSDTIPPELLSGAAMPMPMLAPMVAASPSMVPVMAPMAMPQSMPQSMPTTKAKVLSGGIESLQQGMPQPLSYTPQMQVVQVPRPQSYVPQQMQQVQPVQQQVQQVVYQQQQVPMPAQQLLQQPLSYTPVLQAQALAQQAESAPAVQKMAFGDWAVYEDEMGMFYMQVSTGVQFESPPPELMQAYHQYRAEQDQVHMLKLREIEAQKQQIDLQLAQQTQSLQVSYGFGGGLPCPAA